MKHIAVAFLAAFALSTCNHANAAALTHAETLLKYGPFGPFNSPSDLNATVMCDNASYDHKVLFTVLPGLNYITRGCQFSENQYANITAISMPLRGTDGVDVPVGLVIESSTVNAGAAIAIQGPLREVAGRCMPWFIRIVNNQFLGSAALRVIGSLPEKSQVIIRGNTFAATKPNQYMADIPNWVVGISLGGDLATQFEMMHIFRHSYIKIEQNAFDIDATSVNMFGAAISQLSHINLYLNSSVQINKNTVTAKCTINKECAGLLDTAFYLIDMSEDKQIYATLDDNNVTVTNGKGTNAFLVWSPGYYFGNSVSRNIFTITIQPGGKSAGLSENVISFFDSAYGMDSVVAVRDNTATSNGNAVIFFAGAFELSQEAKLDISGNKLFTTGGDPSIYFAQKLTASDTTSVNINNNVLNRQDETAVTRNYLNLMEDLKFSNSSQFSFSGNKMIPLNLRTGPQMIFMPENKVADFRHDSKFLVCDNMYHGNDAALVYSSVLRPRLASLVFCPTTTTLPTTTTPTTTTATPQPTTSTAPILTSAVPTTAAGHLFDKLRNVASGKTVAAAAAASAIVTIVVSTLLL